ncbi:hypothetical protein F5J12DRAFT_781689 [Pisolithus orientalis]|uniref:uncharacterized protein n=1 Tax=Pisolithus orientalis TaxID=936130 RepID=UPI00222496A6|nr:uncharacterized protein F5J12DRAFT_781689 [Pisolithus orientalis]KAI6010673.1 hypothetical protein F5J12DRAFT_781689 [Pisolithus orientalis]
MPPQQVMVKDLHWWHFWGQHSSCQFGIPIFKGEAIAGQLLGFLTKHWACLIEDLGSSAPAHAIIEVAAQVPTVTLKRDDAVCLKLVDAWSVQACRCPQGMTASVQFLLGRTSVQVAHSAMWPGVHVFDIL